ncbi:unnamed protein product [Cochlearia groenlandica]
MLSHMRLHKLTSVYQVDDIQQDEVYQVLSHPKLSYDESKKDVIRQHLLDLVSKHVSLEPKMVVVKRRDGRFANLLYVAGCVEYSFRGATFSTPIAIGLPEHYPHSPPLIFVNCLDDMIIPYTLSHISRSGMITILYLLSWVHSSCNLLELVSKLTEEFSRQPPILTPDFDGALASYHAFNPAFCFVFLNTLFFSIG